MSGADLTPADEAAVTGFFGKIPAAGDFVSWNLPRSFTDRWDRWFSAELLARPDEGLLDPRAWRFVTPAGVFGDRPVAGVWRMSEDRAGRRYPFVIARLGATPDPGDGWFGRAEALVRQAIDNAWTAERLRGRVRETPSPRTRAAEPRPVFWVEDWEVHEAHFVDAHDLATRGLPAMRVRRTSEARTP